MKILLDSSIYIRGWHDSKFFERYVSLIAPVRPQTYASSVVIGECWAGARDRAGRKLVQTIFKPFEGANRIVTPTRRDWIEAGRLLADMIKTDRSLRARLGSIWHDVLIAFSASRIGATLYTLNRNDFELIKSHKSFSFVLL